MGYIDLNIITKEHLLGTWQVETRFDNKQTASIFSRNYFLIFEPGAYVSRNGEEIKGKWELVREQEVIYNPQVSFYRDAEQIGNAIITRLLNVVEEDKAVQRLTLYFTNGLELILKK